MTIDEYIDYYKKNGYIKEMRKYVGHAPFFILWFYADKKEKHAAS